MEAILLVDAANTFNSLNRLHAALHNVRFLCPSVATTLINYYHDLTNLYIFKEIISSQGGTTQGYPLAMPFDALATLLLIQSLPTSVKQIWYADGATAVGKLQHLRSWWDTLITEDLKYGCFVNSNKSWLVVKENFVAETSHMFKDSDINITNSG